ncbi:MAG: alpha/beta fold hydrolase [Hyphomicrobiales bacterium]|nr:alpha/beta fold hydrolase [Hyphomicrobiales bacterium]
MGRATRSDGTARVRDGIRIAYSLHGDPASSRRATLVHSVAMDRQFWLPVAQRLAKDTAVLALDCRGHGASDKPGGPYTVEQFADDIADVVTHLGWERTLIAGASMGGMVALAFAARHSARTTALGLIDTTAWYGPDAPKSWAARADQAVKQGLKSLIDFQTTRWFSDTFRATNPDVVQHCIDIFLKNDVPAYVEACHMLGRADLRAALPTLKMPTAVVVGEEDYAAPVAMAQALHDGIAGSTFTVLPKARHLTPLEVPDVIAAELDRLLVRGQ